MNITKQHWHIGFTEDTYCLSSRYKPTLYPSFTHVQ